MLDTAIRDWVLIPLSVVMVLIGVLRHFVSKLMRSSQPPDAKIVKEGYAVTSHPSICTYLFPHMCLCVCVCVGIRVVRTHEHTSYIVSSEVIFVCSFFSQNFRQVVVRARNLRSGANLIPPKSFRARRLYFSNEVCLYFVLNLMEILKVSCFDFEASLVY